MPLRYALTQVAPPAHPPLERDKAKVHLNVDTDDQDEDALIDVLIQAARHQAEVFTGRSLITQTWEMRLDTFPAWEIEAPRPPLLSVEGIVYVDALGKGKTLPATAYRVDGKSAPARITPVYGETWPAAQPVTGAVVVTFKAGYGDAPDDVPEDIRQAMLLMVGRWYRYREDLVDAPVARVPSGASGASGAESLLHPYKVWRV